MSVQNPNDLQLLVSSLHEQKIAQPWQVPLPFSVVRVMIDDNILLDKKSNLQDIFAAHNNYDGPYNTVRVYFDTETYPSLGGSFGEGFEKLKHDLTKICHNHGFLISSSGATKKNLNN